MEFSGIKQRLILTIVPALLLSLAHTAGATDINNVSYSYFGLGIEATTYQEQSTGSTFLDFSSSSTPTSIVQYSGSYTAIGERNGFYITTTSPLFTISAQEVWENTASWNNVDYGVVQTNTTELGLSHVEIHGSRIMSPGHQLLAGLKYSTHSFTRYNFAPGSGAASMNTDLLDWYNSLTPEEQSNYGGFADGVAFEIPGCTYHTTPPVEGMGCDSVAILEQITSLSIATGYKYDSLFRSDFSGPRFIFESSLSIPIFYLVHNTSHPGNTLVGSFGGGYGIRINSAASVYSTPELQLMLGMEYSLIHRNQVVEQGNPIKYPHADTQALGLYLIFSWSFK